MHAIPLCWSGKLLSQNMGGFGKTGSRLATTDLRLRGTIKRGQGKRRLKPEESSKGERGHP